jgi:hypothetical protein
MIPRRGYLLLSATLWVELLLYWIPASAGVTEGGKMTEEGWWMEDGEFSKIQCSAYPAKRFSA